MRTGPERGMQCHDLSLHWLICNGYLKFLEHFMFKIAWDDRPGKAPKLKALVLSNDEWNRVELMMELLHVHFFFDPNILH